MPENETYNGHSEQELLLKLTAKEEAAFSVIYRSLYKPLFFYARRFIQWDKAEDILAESFLKLYRYDQGFTSLDHVRNWLRRVVHNGCLNALRNEQRHQEHENRLARLNEKEQEQLLLESETETDLYSRIFAAIDSLPPRQRNILKMCFESGKDNNEIARELQISLQSVKNQKSTALKTLRDHFGGEELLLLTAVFLLGR